MAANFGRVRRDARREVWFVDCRPHGRVYSIPVGRGNRLPIRTEEQARDLLAAIRKDIREGLSPDAAVAYYLPSGGIYFGAQVETYLAHFAERVDAGERSPTTLRELKRYARDHFGPLLNVPAAHIHYGALEDYALALAKRGLSAKTRRNVLGAVRAVLAWLERRGEIRHVPRFPSVSVSTPAPTIISIETQEAILAAIPEASRGIFYAMAELCLRPGEARALNVGDYNPKTRELTVAAAMKGPRAGAPRRATKTGDVRYHVVSNRLALWLETPLRKISIIRPEILPNVPLFRNGSRWDHNDLWDTWKAACKVVGVSVSLYQGTKHATATAMRRAGVPLDVIRAALGHRDTRSTELYSHLAQSAVVEALGRVRLAAARPPDFRRESDE